MTNDENDKSNKDEKSGFLQRRWAVPAALGAAVLVGGVVGAGVFLLARSPSHENRSAAHRAAKPRPAAPAKVDCHVRKCIALTFDDGPVTGTAKLLDILKAHGAHATFFVLGQQVANNQDILKREATEGHQIGNHTFDHAKLTGAPRAKVEDELIRTQEAILQATGTTPTVMRPTYGYSDKQLNEIAKQMGLAQILWTVDTLDWKDRNTAVVTKRVLAGAKPGHIVIMHDIRPTSVAAIPGILDALSKQGYAFVTVSELYGGNLVPGDRYPPFLGSPTAGPAPPT
ncbi:polysaccharide deacetylase family protein [Actinoallomurus soli]|uniref:polysaccharide deacetylase family protein n=1 Tax=Actinoallomurus soli TaxID=2952535 RepID=UPI002092E4BC|nr:polysaccharide deacetylase family protein [Actinoallomurus soli]MCO5967646.1 polysaccharide deacetylase family protein [Actinoallomurus soli]